jgi:hypothetical protein
MNRSANSATAGEPRSAVFWFAGQEQVHKILEIRWKEPDPNDRSKPAEHLEGLNAAAERGWSPKRK